MTTFTITGDDTLTLYSGRVFTDLADDDVSTITFPADLVTLKTGKNKNTVYAKNEEGNNVQLVLRVIRGSSDDRFLNTQQATSDRDFAATELANGEFVKRLGDGQGNVVSDNYVLQGGIIMRRVDSKENVSGDTEQAIVVYTLMFALGTRNIG